MTEKRYEEVFEFNNEVIRIGCPKCGYPMRVLAKDDDNIYQCYCASCKTDRFMKDTFDVEVLTVEQFKRDINRGKGVDGEQISDLIYNLAEENKQLKQRNNRQAKQLAELYELMAKKDWESLTEIIDDFCSCEEQLQREWKCYE